MYLDENKLRSISSSFRNAIRKADLSVVSVGTEAHARMRDFPYGACAEATTLLAIHLIDNYSLKPLVGVVAQIEKAKTWYGSHHWLEHRRIIIDITADQFPMMKNPVIVTRHSALHSRYAKHVFRSPFHYHLEDQLDWMIRLYEAIIRHL